MSNMREHYMSNMHEHYMSNMHDLIKTHISCGDSNRNSSKRVLVLTKINM